jgi:hypothetical protein
VLHLIPVQSKQTLMKCFLRMQSTRKKILRQENHKRLLQLEVASPENRRGTSKDETCFLVVLFLRDVSQQNAGFARKK